MQNILIMLSGMPGTGKSTAAKKLVMFLGFPLVSLLQIRQDRGYRKYDRRRTRSDMEELYQSTFAKLMMREIVVVDSVFLSRETRETYYTLARETNTQVLIIECVCAEKTAKRRMRLRPKNDGTIMEPRDPRVYDKLLKRKVDIVVEELPSHVSYIRYDTEQNEIEDIRVSKPWVKTITGAIRRCLLQ